MTPIRTDAERLAAFADDSLVACLSDLEPLQSTVTEIFARAGRNGRRPTIRDLRAMELECATLVTSTQSLLEAAGFNAAEGSIEDQPHIALTWAADGEGGVCDASPPTDRSIIFPYEYDELDWFVETGRHRPSISGPTVDYGGSNDYTLTVALPILTSGQFAGAVSGDISLRTLERRLSQALPRDNGRVALVTDASRIVLSSEPQLVTGSIVRDVGDWQSIPCMATNWAALYTDPSSSRHRIHRSHSR